MKEGMGGGWVYMCRAITVETHVDDRRAESEYRPAVLMRATERESAGALKGGVGIYYVREVDHSVAY